MAASMIWILAVAAVAMLPATTNALNNGGVARLPVMGFNTWNAFNCNINQDLVLSTAKLMQSLGLQAAGYQYVNIDDCWAQKTRAANGQQVADTTRFSRGMKNLTDTLHGMSFKAGIYGDSGYSTCAGYPGSWGHETTDATTFFNTWGFDLLKYDNCAFPADSIAYQNVLGRYQQMADAISAAKAEVVFSLCNWGVSQVWLWGKNMGQSWRTTQDIGANYASIASIINFNSFITQATDFYGRNDLDMLQIGNGGMTYDEQKTHFTAWALMKAPLLIGTSLTTISAQSLSILKNQELIAINQDSVHGESISPFHWGYNPDWTSDAAHPAQYWSGPSQNGTVIMLLNPLTSAATLSFSLVQSPWLRAGRVYAVRDLWAHTANGTATRTYATSVPAHGVVALLLTDAGPEPANLQPPCMVGYQCGGYGSSTTASGTSTSTTAPTTTTPTTTTTTKPSGSCAALYAQCGGANWAGATCCASGTCKSSNDYYSQCT